MKPTPTEPPPKREEGFLEERERERQELFRVSATVASMETEIGKPRLTYFAFQDLLPTNY